MIAGAEFLRIDSGLILTNETLLEMRVEDQTMYRNVRPGMKGKMSAKKLRADPDDQPPIEERSIMMPYCIRTILRGNPLINRNEFFAPRRFEPPYTCSIKIISDILANAKCNFLVMSFSCGQYHSITA